jgi:hypothetical protein
MSAYGQFETVMKDGRFLADALKSMGFVIEVHKEPQTLLDYRGHKRPEKATIIIRRQHTGIGASNDIGFVKGPDGSYQAIISEYDQGAKFTASWLGQLKQGYRECQTIAKRRAQGYIFQGREVVKTEKGQRVMLSFGMR